MKSPKNTRWEALLREARDAAPPHPVDVRQYVRSRILGTLVREPVHPSQSLFDQLTVTWASVWMRGTTATVCAATLVTIGVTLVQLDQLMLAIELQPFIL